MPRAKTDTDKGRRRQTYTTDRGALVPGEVVAGHIVDHNYATMTYSVQLRGQTVHGVLDMTGVTSGLLGFRSSNRMAPGTQVAVLVGKPSWIVGASAFDLPDAASAHSRSMTGKGIKDGTQKLGEKRAGELPFNNAPDDLYQGEFEIANLTGTFIRFLQFMASIGSGERAKVECHILRDLVRIVSKNFEHFSSSGDLRIFDDGRLSTELNGTSYDHERWGLLEENSKKFEATDTAMPEDMDPTETGRWRYTMLLGFLGDLVNAWFTDPMETAGKMVETAFRSGKARLHVGQDGAILAQSCSEIVLERVTRIPVPIRLKHEEDPQGVLRSEMSKLDAEFLKMWKVKAEDEHHQLFKVREYVRYLNQCHTLARIHQMEQATGKDWLVPSEADTPKPKAGAGEKDRETANPDATYWKDCYSTIRIYRDGSILLMDAYGNATATGAFGIQHSSTRHIHMYAAGDIVQKAGGSVYISSRRHVEVVANRGSLLLKARTGLRALCEVGTLWLKSDYSPDSEYTPEDGDPEAEVVGQQGVRVQAVGGESRWISKKKARFTVNQSDQRLELVSRGELGVKVSRKVDVEIKGETSVSISQTLKIKASEILGWVARGFSLDGICALKRGVSKINFLEAGQLLARFRIGGPKNEGNISGEGQCCYRRHINHITEYDNKTPLNSELTIDSESSIIPPEFPEDPSGNSWKLVPKEEYVWTNPGLEDSKSEFDFEPLAQQHLRLADSASYDDWPKMADKLRPAQETSSDTPWPGVNFKWLQHNPSKPALSTPTSQKPNTFKASIQTPLTTATPTFKFLKR